MNQHQSARIAGKNGGHSEIVHLNLVYDYPVNWSKFKVLRDFIQNFYDALGWQNWVSRFSYEITDGALTIIARETGFKYDWLLYIGASTKREGDANYAGYFGEGFKIASLCAVRDFHWNVELISRDWELMAATADLTIDGRFIKSLAYQIWHLNKEIKDTILCISPFNDVSLLQTVLLSFYYPANPLFGDTIYESKNAAVYFRSAHRKPKGYPSTYDDEGAGIVFAGYQALGSFRYPLIFCLHNYRFNDRERSSFYRMDVIRLIRKTVSKLTPEASAVVLQALKRRWYDRPKEKYDFESWYDIIRILVENIAESSDQKSLWRKNNPCLLAAAKVKPNDIPRYNRRKQALDWLKNSGSHYKLVQEAFLKLGYSTLEDACEQDDGFSITRDPTVDEMRCIQILEELCLAILPDLFENIKLPPCQIIKTKGSVWQGMTTCIPIKESDSFFRGIRIRYQLPHIALKQTLLHPDKFGDALSTYLHELAHLFGGDRSASFSRALSEFMEITLSNACLIANYQMRWKNL